MCPDLSRARANPGELSAAIITHRDIPIYNYTNAHRRSNSEDFSAERAAANQQYAGFQHFAPSALETATYHNVSGAFFWVSGAYFRQYFLAGARRMLVLKGMSERRAPANELTFKPGLCYLSLVRQMGGSSMEVSRC